MNAQKSAGASARYGAQRAARDRQGHDWVLDKAFTWDLLRTRGVLCGNHPAIPNQWKLKSNLRIAKSETKRKIQTSRRQTHRPKTPVRMRKLPSPRIGGACHNNLPIGPNPPRPIRPKTALLQTSPARPMFISAVTRRSFH